MCEFTGNSQAHINLLTCHWKWMIFSGMEGLCTEQGAAACHPPASPTAGLLFRSWPGALTCPQRKARPYTFHTWNSIIFKGRKERRCWLVGSVCWPPKKVSQHWLNTPHTFSTLWLHAFLILFQARVNEFKEGQEQPMEWRASHMCGYEAVRQVSTNKL